MNNNLPAKIVLFFLIVILLIAGAYTLVPDQMKRDAKNFIPELIEKRSLKPPPPYKKLSDEESHPASIEGKLKYPHDYTLLLVGDSMTEALGNSDELRGYLNEYYPDKTFEVLNYSYGSTNLLSAKTRLLTQTYHGIRDYRPALDINFDYLIVESFGHNPLSEFKEEGLKKQAEALDDLMALVATTSGKEKVIFLATIGANRETYVQTGQPDLTPEKRSQWADERNAYIRNHIEYARSHGIPVIDAYSESLDPGGDTKQYLVRDDDFIHPSPSGVLFISKKIADFLAKGNFIK